MCICTLASKLAAAEVHLSDSAAVLQGTEQQGCTGHARVSPAAPAQPDKLADLQPSVLDEVQRTSSTHLDLQPAPSCDVAALVAPKAMSSTKWLQSFSSAVRGKLAKRTGSLVLEDRHALTAAEAVASLVEFLLLLSCKVAMRLAIAQQSFGKLSIAWSACKHQVPLLSCRAASFNV